MSRAEAVAASLRTQRPELDARLAEAVAAGAEPAVLRDGLRDVVTVAERAGGTGEQLDTVVAALVDQVCVLAVRGVGRVSAERLALRDVVGRLGPWLRADPAGCVAQTAHAAGVLAHRPGALDGWLRRLPAAAARSDDAEQLRQLGVVAAWRSGIVRLRDAALRAAQGLPADALAAVLEVRDDPVAVLRANTADPWTWPGREPRPGELRIIARSGGFTGFGGPWSVPPVVLDGDGLRWRIRAGPAERLLLWDVHGDAVLPTGAAELDGRSRAVAAHMAHGVLRLSGLRARAPWHDDVTGAAAVGRTAVLSRAGSHHLDLLRAGETR